MPRNAIKMPATLQRSSPKAQRTFSKTLESAEERYGPGERAMRIAYAALKHSFEKVGNHWTAKEMRGPSDSRAKQSGVDARAGKGETFGGVDVEGHTRQELYARARALDVAGRSTMSKAQLARAISKKQG